MVCPAQGVGDVVAVEPVRTTVHVLAPQAPRPPPPRVPLRLLKSSLLV
jgi:hypothetical protein